MILLPLLLLTALGAALLAPFLAAHVVLVAPVSAASRWSNWIGLGIGAELALAFPLCALAFGIYGPAEWPYYRLALLFAALAPVLAFFVIRAHVRCLQEVAMGAGRTGLACLAAGLAVALALLPWILGAPLPLPSGELGAEQSVAGSARDYASFVLPFALAMDIEAWLLLRGAGQSHEVPGRRRDRLGAAAGVGLAVLVACATLLLPRTGCNSRWVAANERAALRARAETLDGPRGQALQQIVAGHAPALLPDPCPSFPEEWRALGRFADPPRDWHAVVTAANAWREHREVTPWLPGVARNDERQTPRFAGPLRRAIFTSLDEEAWRGPWPERDIVVAPTEARRRVREHSLSAPWDSDGTLVVARETPSYSTYGQSNLGLVYATLWLWSYHEQSFVCAGQARVLPVGFNGMFSDAQAPIARDALRMRALAIAADALRAVERPR